MTDIVNQELMLIRDDYDYLPSGASLDYNFRIIDTPQWSLSARILSPEHASRSLITSSTHLMLGVSKVFGSENVVFKRYEAAKFDQNSIDRYKKLKLVECNPITFGDGEWARLYAGKDIYSYEPSSSMPILILIFESPQVTSFRWEFDPDTMFPRRLISGNITSSRIEFTTNLLARLGDMSSLPSLLKLSKHPHHFVRWGAIRAIVAIDKERGEQVLNNALVDNHPHIRNAAHAALVKLSELVPTSSQSN